MPPAPSKTSIWNGPNCEPTATILDLESVNRSSAGRSRILPPEASCANSASTSRRNPGSASASQAARSASARSRTESYSSSICRHRSGVIGDRPLEGPLYYYIYLLRLSIASWLLRLLCELPIGAKLLGPPVRLDHGESDRCLRGKRKSPNRSTKSAERR